MQFNVILESDLKRILQKLDELIEQKSNPHSQNAFGLKESWLDNQDVMQILKIKPRTLQSYRDQGILPFTRIGGKILFKSSDVEAALQANMVNEKGD